MLKIMREGLLIVAGGHISNAACSMSINILSYDPGPTSTCNVILLIFASLKFCQRAS